MALVCQMQDLDSCASHPTGSRPSPHQNKKTAIGGSFVLAGVEGLRLGFASLVCFALSNHPSLPLGFLGASRSHPTGSRPIPVSKQKTAIGGSFVLAGVEGLEPSRTVLETGMLPLHHTPIYLLPKYYTKKAHSCQAFFILFMFIFIYFIIIAKNTCNFRKNILKYI